MALALRSVFLLCGLLAGVLALPEVTYCPKGWVQLDNMCYMFVNNRRTFIDAERVCILKGGNLASILDAKENALAIELIRESFGEIRDTWLGLHDGVQEGQLQWNDGSKVHYTAFNPTQPDDFGGAEDCVEIDNLPLGWNDDQCTDLNYFLCAKEAHRH